ncbi:MULTISPECIES: TetR/AcrR family transcriptional regulator [Micrococcaceae]|uniref:TetR/AcrR family transcriptional regulator n=1 Tax=Micrococcaceae TaxID=1268 RepID=UPI000BB717E8|nr:TetR/AcrR family transcriptional regulator [Glutamicibacter sp. BW78]PCC26740.1 hypothetical protein CIK75_01145 [Glutamicibacter sp. BW78]
MKRAPLHYAAVVQAAAELADRDGFEAITVSALAREVGVRPASLYSHVKDLAALLDGLHELVLGEVAEAVAAGIAGRSGYEALVGLGEAQRDFAGQHPGRWAVLARPATPKTARSAGAIRLVDLTFSVLRGYRLPETELVHATRFMGATVNGFLALDRASSFEHRDEQTRRSWSRALDALDRALASWPTTSEQEHS